MGHALQHLAGTRRKVRATTLNVAERCSRCIHRTTSFVAVKVLTGHMTEPVLDGRAFEPAALEALALSPSSPYCPQLLDQFTTPSRGSSGHHHCLVMPLYGGDIHALRKSEDSPFPLPLTKRILLHLVRALAHAHSRNVVHTDLKTDNIFFTTSLTTADIERWLAEDPSRYHAEEQSLEGVVQAAVSQPLPPISRDEALRATFVLADFGMGACLLFMQLLSSHNRFSPAEAHPQRRGHHYRAPASAGGLPRSQMGPAR